MRSGSVPPTSYNLGYSGANRLTLCFYIHTETHGYIYKLISKEALIIDLVPYKTKLIQVCNAVTHTWKIY